MKAVITSISRKNLAAGEAFTMSVKLTLGSSETAINGEVSLTQFIMDGYDPDAYSGSDAGTVKNVKIAKGASKTLTFTSTAMPRWMLIADSPDGGAARAYKYGIGVSAECSDGAHTAELTNVGIILTDRLDPVIDSVTITDPTGGLDHFGVLAQNMSTLNFTGAATLDPLDTSLTATHTFKMAFYDAGKVLEYTSTDGVFTDIPIPYTGKVAWTYSVTDSVGNSTPVNDANANGSFDVEPYVSPTISALTATRYGEQVADDGTISYVPSDDGEHVWFDLTGAVCPLQDKNAWTLAVAWSDQSKTIREGTDGESIALTQDRDAVSDTISAAERVEFTWTLTDFFASTVMRVTVNKADAYFSVEKNGVAVGMRATGTEKDKKFEVAQDYKSHFHGGAYGSDGYRMDRVAKTENLELATGWAAYADEFTPRVSRVGALVFLDGLMKNTTAQSAGFAATVATLPEWARPATDAYAIHQGSGQAIWWLRVYAETGAVGVGRYRTGTGTVDAAVGRQFPLTLSWIAADAFE